MKMKNQNRDLKIKTMLALGIYAVAFATLVYVSKPEPEIQKSELMPNIEYYHLFDPPIEYQFAFEDQEAAENVSENKVAFYPITESERHELISIVAGEAEGESFEGKMAVAQCLLDNMVYENSGVDGIKWKFNGYNPDLENTNPEVWAECEEAVSRVFDIGYTVSCDTVLWYYNPSKVRSNWHEQQEYLFTIGNHRFFGIKNS